MELNASLMTAAEQRLIVPQVHSLLGDIAESNFTYCDRCYCSMVCLSCLCIVLKRQKVFTQYLLHTTAPCLSQILLKF